MEAIIGIITNTVSARDPFNSGAGAARNASFRVLRREFEDRGQTLCSLRTFVSGGVRHRIIKYLPGNGAPRRRSIQRYDGGRWCDNVELSLPPDVVVGPYLVPHVSGLPAPPIMGPLTVIDSLLVSNWDACRGVPFVGSLPRGLRFDELSIRGEGGSVYKSLFNLLLLVLSFCFNPSVSRFLSSSRRALDNFDGLFPLLFRLGHHDPFACFLNGFFSYLKADLSSDPHLSALPGHYIPHLLENVKTPTEVFLTVLAVRLGNGLYHIDDLKLAYLLNLYTTSPHKNYYSTSANLIASGISRHFNLTIIAIKDGVVCDPSVPHCLRRYIPARYPGSDRQIAVSIYSKCAWYMIITDAALTTLDSDKEVDELVTTSLVYIMEPGHYRAILPCSKELAKRIYVGYVTPGPSINPLGRMEHLFWYDVGTYVKIDGYDVVSPTPYPHTLKCIDCNMGVSPLVSPRNLWYGSSNDTRMRISGRFYADDLSHELGSTGDLVLHVGHRCKLGPIKGRFPAPSPTMSLKTYISLIPYAVRGAYFSSPVFYCFTCSKWGVAGTLVGKKFSGPNRSHDGHLVQYLDWDGPYTQRYHGSWYASKIMSLSGDRWVGSYDSHGWKLRDFDDVNYVNVYPSARKSKYSKAGYYQYPGKVRLMDLKLTKRGRGYALKNWLLVNDQMAKLRPSDDFASYYLETSDVLLAAATAVLGVEAAIYLRGVSRKYSTLGKRYFPRSAPALSLRHSPR